MKKDKHFSKRNATFGVISPHERHFDTSLRNNGQSFSASEFLLMRNFPKKSITSLKKSVTSSKKRHFAKNASFRQKSVTLPKNVISLKERQFVKKNRKYSFYFLLIRVLGLSSFVLVTLWRSDVSN